MPTLVLSTLFAQLDLRPWLVEVLSLLANDFYASDYKDTFY